MYKFIASLSVLIRTFCLPNPFEPLGENFDINLFGTSISMTPFLLNLIVGATILTAISYCTTGLYYSKGSNPAKGSFLYLFFYCVYTSLLHLMSLAEFDTYAVIFIITIYLLSHIGFNVLKNKICHFGI